MYQENSNQKEAGIVKSMQNKIDFEGKRALKKKNHCIMPRGSVYQEDNYWKFKFT